MIHLHLHLFLLELHVGLEPTTCALQVRCSANWANGANSNLFKVTNCPKLQWKRFKSFGVYGCLSVTFIFLPF